MNDPLTENLFSAKLSQANFASNYNQPLVNLLLLKQKAKRYSLPLYFRYLSKSPQPLCAKQLFCLTLQQDYDPISSFRLKKVKESWYQCAKQTSARSECQNLYLSISAQLLGIPYQLPLIKHNPESTFQFNRSDTFNSAFIFQHVKLTLLLSLYQQLKGCTKLKKQTDIAAKWHFELLNKSLLPFEGLLSNHEYASYQDLVLYQGILFCLKAHQNESPQFLSAAKAHFDFIKSLSEKSLAKLDTEALFLLNWINKKFPQHLADADPVQEPLLEQKKPQIIGVRDELVQACFCFGKSNCSLGSIVFDDLEIMGFGPQFGEVASGKTFGVIGEQKEVQKIIERTQPIKFAQKATVGVPQLKNLGDSENIWKYAESWLEMQINYHQGEFEISLIPICINQPFNFEFYIKADQCLIKDQKKILHHSLEQYKGPASNIAFLSAQKMISIDFSDQISPAKIIPLQGGESFWGANYLISYPIGLEEVKYKWTLKLSKR